MFNFLINQNGFSNSKYMVKYKKFGGQLNKDFWCKWDASNLSPDIYQRINNKKRTKCQNPWEKYRKAFTVKFCEKVHRFKCSK